MMHPLIFYFVSGFLLSPDASQDSLLLSFSIVNFYSFSTLERLSNWKVNLSSIIFFSLIRVLSSCSFFLLLSSSPSILFLAPIAFSLASSIFCACCSRTSVKVVTISLKDIISTQNKGIIKVLTLQEVYALALQVLSLSVLVRGENSYLIILIKGDVHVDLSSLHNLF